MAYLRLQDYFSTIQNQTLQQILTNIDSYRTTEENVSRELIESYLTQKYDLTEEFKDTVLFNYSATYTANQLVYINATAYSSTSTYALNALTLYQGNIYFCNTAVTVGEAFNGAKWTLIGEQYALFYVTLPKPEFSVYAFYKVGDEVFYKGKIYTCKRETTSRTHGGDLQYNKTNDIPLNNLFPNEPLGVNQWGTGTAYSVTGVMPTNATKWTLGDNRSALIVKHMVHLTIYGLSSRISPNNVPDVWVKNYDDTISWLKRCSKGETSLNAPLKQPRKGRIRWGSEVKKINNY